MDLVADAEAHWTTAGRARGVPQRYSTLDPAEGGGGVQFRAPTPATWAGGSRGGGRDIIWSGFWGIFRGGGVRQTKPNPPPPVLKDAPLAGPNFYQVPRMIGTNSQCEGAQSPVPFRRVKESLTIHRK